MGANLKLLGAGLVVLVGSNVATGLIVANSKDDTQSTGGSKTSTSSGPIQPTIDTTKTVTAKSPNDIINDPNKFIGHKVAVNGIIMQFNDSYNLVSQEAKPAAIKLDFSGTKLDPSDYANSTPQSASDPSKAHVVQTGPYTVTGILKPGNKTTPVVLVVQSVTEVKK